MADSRPAEDAVVTAARGGDLRAWEHITRRHQEVVFRTAYLTTRDSTSAEETAKSAFVRAHRSLGSLGTGAPMAPWLMGITATVARSHLREKAQRRDAKVPDAHPSPRLPATPVRLEPGVTGPTPLEHEALVDAFDGLADDDRIILAARYAFGLSRAAAAQLGMPAEQVDARLVMSVARLRSRASKSMAESMAGPVDVRAGAGHSVRVDRLAALGDDQLGSVTLAAVMSELPWTPDVAPTICARLAREAVAYAEPSAAPAPASASNAASIASSAARSGAGPGTGMGQGSAAVPAGARVSQRPAPRGGDFVSMKVAVLVVFVALVGFSVAVGDMGRGVTPATDPAIGAPLDGAESHLAAGQGVETMATRPASVAADAPGAAVAAPQDLTLRAPQLSIVGARTLSNGDVGARVRIDWSPAAGFDPVVRTQLERNVSAGDWRYVASTDAGGRLEAGIEPGERYTFRVRSFDEAGREVVSPPVDVELAVRDPRSKRLGLAPDDWLTRRGDTIKRRLIATAPDATFSTEFHGSGVALVGPVGPTRGAIGVRVDGGPWTRDDLTTWLTSPRTVVFSKTLEPGRHSLDVRAEADGVAVDAVVIVRAGRM